MAFCSFVLIRDKKDKLFEKMALIRMFMKIQYLVFFSFFFGVIGKRIFETVKSMDIKINDNEKFKNIFNSIDESIIILKQEDMEIDYVNNQFLSTFQTQIENIYDKISFEEVNDSKCKRILAYIKSCFQKQNDENQTEGSQFLTLQLFRCKNFG